MEKCGGAGVLFEEIKEDILTWLFKIASRVHEVIRDCKVSISSFGTGVVRVVFFTCRL